MKIKYISTATLIVAFMGSIGFCVEPQAAPLITGRAENNGPAARIQFAAPIYNFGKVAAGATVQHNFVFADTGEAPLKIIGVHPSCGCTTAGNWSRLVEPGKSGSIPIRFHNGSFGTSFLKTISVICNDPTHRVIRLEIKGTIWKPIEVVPHYAILRVPTNTSSNISATVLLMNRLKTPVTLSDPRSNSSGFAAELKTIEPGKKFQLTVKAEPPFDISKMHGIITLKTSLTNATIVTVPVLAFRQHK